MSRGPSVQRLILSESPVRNICIDTEINASLWDPTLSIYSTHSIITMTQEKKQGVKIIVASLALLSIFIC
jgi:hypothetical protein